MIDMYLTKHYMNFGKFELAVKSSDNLINSLSGLNLEKKYHDPNLFVALFLKYESLINLNKLKESKKTAQELDKYYDETLKILSDIEASTILTLVKYLELKTYYGNYNNVDKQVRQLENIILNNPDNKFYIVASNKLKVLKKKIQ